MSHQAAHPLDLEDEALRYAREELNIAGGDLDGPLARLLIDLPLGTPFGFLKAEAATRVQDLRRGGVDDGSSDEHLAAGISRWLANAPSGTTRVLVLEDPLARRTDAAAADDVLHVGERVYFAGVSGEAPDRIERVLRRPAGYPGIGVLSELAAGSCDSADVTEQALHSLASDASAVLVRAWDDEAFIVVPVGQRLTCRDLRP